MPRVKYDPAVRERAYELFIKMNPHRRRAAGVLKRVHRFLVREYGDMAPSYKTLSYWAVREKWWLDPLPRKTIKPKSPPAEPPRTVEEAEVRQELLNTAKQELGRDEELEKRLKKLHETFQKAGAQIIIWQLQLTRKLNEMVRQIDPQSSRFARLVEVTNTVNKTSFDMLREIGYGGQDMTKPPTPVIIINEIDGRQIVINNVGGEHAKEGQDEGGVSEGGGD